MGEFWHVHLVAVIAWVAALSILKFGTRAAARTRVAWFYLFVCFPPIFLLTGQALGGSLLAYGALTALYGAVAMFLALRQQDIRWVVAPIYFGLAFAGTYLLRNGVVPLAYLLPNAVLTLLTITLFVRAPRERGRADIPRHSLLTVAVVIALSALVGLAPKQPVTHTPRSDLMWVRADWVNGTAATQASRSGPPDVFAWGPRVMGGQRLGGPIPASSSGRTEAFLDVFSTRDYGRLTEYCCGLWYATAPPPDVEKQFISSAGVIKPGRRDGQSVLAARAAGAIRLGTPITGCGAPELVQPWSTRRCISSLHAIPKAPENVAAPQPPTFRTRQFSAPLTALDPGPRRPPHTHGHTTPPGLAALTDTDPEQRQGGTCRL